MQIRHKLRRPVSKNNPAQLRHPGQHQVKFGSALYVGSCQRCGSGTVQLNRDLDYTNTLTCLNCGWTLYGEVLV